MYVKAVGTGLIFPRVQNKGHLLALPRVSRKLRSLIFPHLFEVLNIKPYNEMVLWDFDSYPYFDQEMIARVPNVLTAVTDLRYSTPFEYTDPVGSEDVRRCPHSFIPESSPCSIDSLASEDELYHLQEDDGAVMREREDTKTMEELLDSEYGDYGLIKLAIKIVRLLSALLDNQLIVYIENMNFKNVDFERIQTLRV